MNKIELFKKSARFARVAYYMNEFAWYNMQDKVSQHSKFSLFHAKAIQLYGRSNRLYQQALKMENNEPLPPEQEAEYVKPRILLRNI